MTAAPRTTPHGSLPELPSSDGITSVTFCGMGGSAVSGDVVRSVFLERLGLPVEVNRSPVLPRSIAAHTRSWCVPRTRGNAPETLASFRAALEREVPGAGGDVPAAPIAEEAEAAGVGIVSVPAGYQPRAALGHLGFASLGALEAMGILPPLAGDVDEAVAQVSAVIAGDGTGRLDGGQPGEDARHEDRRPLSGHLGNGRDRLGGGR